MNKQERMACIIAAKHWKPCTFCGKPSVRVGSLIDDKGLQIHYYCRRHYGFNEWTDYNTALGYA